jgi:site-specific recombinase XerD
VTELARVEGHQLQPAGVELPAGLPHPVDVYLHRLRPSSRPTMRAALGTIAGIVAPGVDAYGLPWWRLTYAHTQGVRADLADRYSPATANRHLSALRGVLQESWKLGLMGAEQMRQATEVKNISGSTLPAGRHVARGEVLALAAGCDATPAGVRDAAILGVMFSGGLRRAELVGLDLGDLDLDSGDLTVRHGKGDKARVVYVQNGALQALAAWVELRGLGPGPLFCPLNRAGRPQVGRRLTGEGVRVIVKRRAALAGVRALTPHDGRRTFAGELLDAGADIVTVQGLMGHASVETTARYDRRPAEARRRAAALLHFPYMRPRGTG